MRRVVLALVAVVLVNLPWANDAWVQHQLDSSGIHTHAIVVQHSHKRGRNFVSFRFSKAIDPQEHLYEVVVTDQAYRDASTTGQLGATVLRGSPASNRVEGEVTGSEVIAIAAIGDAIILLLLAVTLVRRRRWTRFRVTAVEDDLVTLALGGLQLTTQLAGDPDTQATIKPIVGAKIRGDLYLVPDDDVVEGPPLGEVTQISGPEYRIAGRVRAASVTHTDLVLDNGYVLLVYGDEVAHVAELRGPAVATGRLVLAARRPM